MAELKPESDPPMTTATRSGIFDKGADDRPQQEEALREQLLSTREAGLAQREASLAKREHAMAQREASQASRDERLEIRAEATRHRESKLDQLGVDLGQREREVARRETDVAELEALLAEREQQLTRREDLLLRQQDAVAPAQLPTRRDDIDVAWSDPRSLIALDIIHRLMASGEEALFQSNSQEERPDYRATAFWPVPTESAERLYPFLRGEFARNVRLCSSRLYFLSGEMFAGEAWRLTVEGKPGTSLKSGELPALSDCENNEDTWRQKWEAQGVPPRITRQMTRAAGYACEVRSVACVAVESRYGKIVFCIDSHHSNAFEKHRLTECARKQFDRQTPFGTLLNSVQARVDSHRDFVSWLRVGCRGVSPFLAGTTTLLPFLALGWSLLQSTLSPRIPGALSAVPPLAVVWAPAIAAILYLVAGWWFLPIREDLSGWTLARLRPRLKSFISAWNAVLVFEAGPWLVFAAQRPLQLDKLGTAARLLDLSSNALAVGAAYYSFSAYCALLPDRKTVDDDGVRPSHREKLWFVVALVPMAALTCADHAAAVRGTIGVVAAVISALVIGRLSELGPPAAVVALLYLGAVLHLLCCIAAPGHAALLYILRLPLDVLSFLVVTWSIRGAAFERFLLAGEQLGGVLRRPSVDRPGVTPHL